MGKTQKRDKFLDEYEFSELDKKRKTKSKLKKYNKYSLNEFDEAYD